MSGMVLLRRLIGDVLRRHRLRQSRTLRDVSAAAKVSLGYLSEVERGRKEASSELLAAICEALDVSLADVLREVSADLTALERRAIRPVRAVPRVAVGAGSFVPAMPSSATSTDAAVSVAASSAVSLAPMAQVLSHVVAA
jgi:transcriptional regulator with XRE-family HTH domain